MFLHIATYYATVIHILSELYIIVHWGSVSSCKRTSLLGLNDINCQYTRHVISITWRRSLWITYCHRCLHTQFKKYKKTENYNTRGSLLYGVIIIAILIELVNMSNSEFSQSKNFHFMMELMVTSAWSMCWIYNPWFLIKSLKMAPSSQNT